MKQIPGGVTSPKGFQAASAAAGIKYQNRRDMALIYSKTPCQAAGTFTTNVVKAAPVAWDQELVGKRAPIHAIVANAGIANACTGQVGREYCREMAAEVAACLGIPLDSVLVASTGVIGKQLPMDRIQAGIQAMGKTLGSSLEDGSQAAQAIMTTDRVKKEVAVQFQAGGKTVTLGGMCKGSGMIHPNMCTMLSFLATDLSISSQLLQEALSEDVKDTYNMVSVDGDTSTNDTVLLLANGMAKNPRIVEKGQDYQAFLKALRMVDQALAKMMAGDGEGATALLEAQVEGALHKAQAALLAKSIVSSNLTKAAIFGHDANWGRILCAMGYSGASFDPEKVDLHVESKAGKLKLVEDGLALDYSETEAGKILSQPEVRITADLKMGKEKATAWGCDLTYDYVKINADYRS